MPAPNNASNIHIIVNDAQCLNPEFAELVKILYHLRHYTTVWGHHYGYDNRKRKEYWEQKADQWLQEHLQTNTNDTTTTP